MFLENKNKIKSSTEMSPSQTSHAVCPTSRIMTSEGFSTSILKVSSSFGLHFHPSEGLCSPLFGSNFSMEKMTRNSEQISTAAEKKMVKRNSQAKLKTDNLELDNIVDDTQRNFLRLRQIVQPETRNRLNEAAKDFEQNCPRLTLENHEALNDQNVEVGKLIYLHPRKDRASEKKFNSGRKTPCKSNRENDHLNTFKYNLQGFDLDNPKIGVRSLVIQDQSPKLEGRSTPISTNFLTTEAKEENCSSPKDNKGFFLFMIASSAPTTVASLISSREGGSQSRPLFSSTHTSVSSTSNLGDSSTSHLSSSSHRFSLSPKKGKFGPLTRTFLSTLFTLLTAIPAFAKGPDESSISSNVFGGFSKLNFEQQLFLQDNHTTTKAQSGATAALHCALSAPLADGLVSWVRRRDYHLLTVGRQVYSSDQRVGIKVSPDGSDWVLTIRWVSSHDAGQYECQVSSHPPQALMINLSVVEAHAEILGVKERYIHSGSSLRLVCLLREATESPVYVFWYRGDRMINYDKEQGVRVDNSREASVLYVTSVTGRDEGNYTCLPSNASPASVTVHVVHKENPAHLQQETNTEKESNPSSSLASAPSSSLTSSSSSSSSSSRSFPSSPSSSATLASSCVRHVPFTLWNMMFLCLILCFIPKVFGRR